LASSLEAGWKSSWETVACPDFSISLGDPLCRWRACCGGRRIENEIDAPVATARAHHALSQAGERHIPPARPNQRSKVKFGLMMALGGRPRVGDHPPKASRMNAPAGRKGIAKGLNLHENIWRTARDGVKGARQRSEPPALGKFFSRHCARESAIGVAAFPKDCPAETREGKGYGIVDLALDTYCPGRCLCRDELHGLAIPPARWP
jgi:hypothetical protein